ncbi:septum formation initiator family protein [Tepidiforma flava]|uniref:Septum formation initiator family protein n=1 Tax=Tepidiforma flava TaxID=3004094 RepID=A0ABY7M791_9CHLR|nr:septum formation initiator family protein [Tepidiforma flava]WBL36167.1 septum formation initiator family protein [Tepidiforma flava]
MAPPLLSRSRLVIVVSLLIGGYFVYTAVLGMYRSSQLSESRARAEEQLRALEEQKAYLEAVRAYVASDAYVEQEARRRYGYIREGKSRLSSSAPGRRRSAALRHLVAAALPR